MPQVSNAAPLPVAVTAPVPDMQPADPIESVRFVGGFGGLELRGAEPRSGMLAMVIANPGTTAIDRAPTDLGIAFHREVSGN